MTIPLSSGVKPLFDGSSEEAEDRLLIEISDWDWGLHVAMAPELLPQEQRFQGGLLYRRSLDIIGTVVSPDRHSGKDIRLSLLPFGSDVQFGPDGLQELGQLYEAGDRASGAHFTSTLILPEDALPNSDYFLWNEIPTVLGNLVGGLTFVGATLYSTHYKTSPKRGMARGVTAPAE